MFRRMWCNHSSMRDTCNELILQYIEQQLPGLIAEPDQVRLLPSGIVAELPSVALSTGESRAGGPFGLLAKSLASIDVWLDGELWLYKVGRMPVSLVHDPWNGVVRFISECFSEHALLQVPLARTACDVPGLIDPGATLRAAHKLTESAKAMLRAVWAGAIWTSKEAHKAAYQADDRCIHCGSLGGGCTTPSGNAGVLLIFEWMLSMPLLAVASPPQGAWLGSALHLL